MAPHSMSTASTASRPAPPESLVPARKQHQFLGTKVVSPQSQGLIERPRLVDMISQFSGKRLAVIKAPPGFGKTSLAAAWSEQLRRGGNSVAWLTIDSDDDEPARFLFYVAQALQHAHDGVGVSAIDLINETFLISPQAIVSLLINDLADVDEEVYLFLEDYHWISHPEIDGALAFFLKHAPSHCHVAVATRAEPPLPLASLLDAPALRFDLHETADFFEHERPGRLALPEVRLLHAKTEGWPAALRIVASTSSQPGQDFGKYVSTLSGTQRPIG